MAVLGNAITLTSAAKQLGVTPQTLRRWASSGRIMGAYKTLGGHTRLPPEAVRSVAKQMGLCTRQNPRNI